MRRQLTLGVALGIAVLLVLDAVATRSGLAAGVIPKLTGVSLWITSRAAGVTAFLALSLDVAFGLFISTRAADRLIPRARVVEVHQWLSVVALATTAIHAGALLGDRFVRFDVLDLLVPFLSTYRPLAVALGVVAAYGLLVVHLSFSWRKRIGAKVWRSLHYASFGAYAAALIHGVAAGTDARALSGVYLASAGVVGALVAYRLAAARRGAAGRRAQPPLTPARAETSKQRSF
ncbi:MAG: ferric reductase-like transmembrane domain-containing protein [Polyangiaceae bacterium]